MTPSRKDADRLIEATMETAGFIKARPMVYCCPLNGANIHHFIWFEMRATDRKLLSAIVEFGNIEADRFAARCLTQYGGPLYSADRLNPEEPLLRFSLGRIADWEPGGAIAVDSLAPAAIANQLAATLEAYITPNVSALDSRQALFDSLRSDEDPFAWAYTNGAVRATQVIHLGARLGIGVEEISRNLAPFKRYVCAQLSPGADGDAFVERL